MSTHKKNGRLEVMPFKCDTSGLHNVEHDRISVYYYAVGTN